LCTLPTSTVLPVYQISFVFNSHLFYAPQERDGPPKKRYLDFLDILLTARDDTGAGMTPLEIRSEVDTFMVEGK
jgi:hypothetical protein